MEEEEFTKISARQRQEHVVVITKKIEDLIFNEITPIEAYGILELIKMNLFYRAVRQAEREMFKDVLSKNKVFEKTEK